MTFVLTKGHKKEHFVPVFLTLLLYFLLFSFRICFTNFHAKTMSEEKNIVLTEISPAESCKNEANEYFKSKKRIMNLID